MSSSLVDGEGFVERQRMKDTKVLLRCGIDGKEVKFREGKRREGDVVTEAIDGLILNPKGV